MQVPVPGDGEVFQPTIQSAFPAMFRGTMPRARSLPHVGLQPLELPITTAQYDLRHGSTEHVQATVDQLVDVALDPRNIALENPLRDYRQRPMSRGRPLVLPTTQAVRATANMFTQKTIHMEKMEAKIQKHEDEFLTVDTKLISVEAELQLVKLHLQHERAAN